MTTAGIAVQPSEGVVVRSEAGLRVETVSSEAEFEALADSWDDLVRAMPRPSPFLLHGWLLEWWRHYGGRSELAVHVAYRGDAPVAALPLCTTRRFGLRVTEFVGGTWALLADVLVAPGEDEAVESLVERVASSGHDFANLFGLTGSSRLAGAVPPYALRLVERLEAPVLDLSAGWDAVYRAHISSKARSERRRRWRQLEELGTVETSVARTADELASALEEAYRVYALRWRGRRDPSGFVTPAGRAFHNDALRRLAELDVPRIVTIRLDDRPIAFALALQLSGRTYGVTMAFDPAYGRFGPGAEAKLLSLQTAAEEGVTRVELLGAAAAHKQRFTDWYEPIYQGIGLARTARGRAAAEVLVNGIAIRRRLKRSRTAQRLYARLRRP
jgi:CelD/BcsL family acetyltransferase involved in cellulose biosynthesis